MTLTNSFTGSKADRELWFEGPRQVSLRRAEEVPLLSGSIRARALASGVSQGTELLLYRGEGPTPFDASLGKDTCTTYPCRYGYCWVGEVTHRADDVKDLSLGARIFALAPHGDVHVLPACEVNELSANIPPVRGVLAANLQAAITCIWDAEITLGDRVTVFGGGIVGLLTAWLASRSGAHVTLVEAADARRRVAAEFDGLCVLEPAQLNALPESDIVIEATGNPATLDSAIHCAGFEARIVVVSFYGARSHPVRLGDRFHRRRLSIRSSQVSTIPATRAARWSRSRRFDLVRRFLDETQLDTLIDHQVPFEVAPEVYAELDQHPSRFMQTVFIY